MTSFRDTFYNFSTSFLKSRNSLHPKHELDGKDMKSRLSAPTDVLVDCEGPNNTLLTLQVPSEANGLWRMAEQNQEAERMFFAKVEGKRKSGLIGQEAMDEARVDLIIELSDGDITAATMYLLTKWPYQTHIPRFISILIGRSVCPSLETLRDTYNNTPLHIAASRNHVLVAEFLLADYPEMLTRTNSQTDLPVETALKCRHDDVAAYLIKHMSNRSVLQLFRASESENARHSFVSLVKEYQMKKTILAILDAMVVPQWPYPVSLHYHNTLSSEWQTLADQPTHLEICYDLIDSDKYGRTPDHPAYRFCPKSSFYYITRECQNLNKALIRHPVVKLITERKWNKYGSFWFSCRGKVIQLFRFINYLVFLAALSTGMMSLVANPSTQFQANYTKWSIVSTCCFAWCLIMVCWFLLDEFAEMKREPRQYFRDWTNYWDILRNVLLGGTLLMRFNMAFGFWFAASISVLVNTMGIFKYSLVFSLTSSYTRVLGRVIYRDIPRFTVVFIIVVFSFFLSITIALRARQPQAEITQLIIGSGFGVESNGNNCTSPEVICIMTSLLRIWTQGQPILEDNTAYLGYSASILVYLSSMCVSVILLNVLIAQLSHTYESVQEESNLSSVAQLMHAICTVEFQSRFQIWNLRVKYYTPKDRKVREEIKELLKDYKNACSEDTSDKQRIEQLEKNVLYLNQMISRQEHSRRSTRQTTVM